MEWWSIFRKVRVIVFAFVAVLSLIWAIILSLYLAREWSHFDLAQRIIVLCTISVGGFTSIFIYLMIVVVFRLSTEFLRIAFLLAIHIGSAIPFSLVVFDLSCTIFDSSKTCKEVDTVSLASIWAITGLLVGYSLLLCIMSRVRRPIPASTLDLLLEPEVFDRRASVTSQTGLLDHGQEEVARPARPASVHSQEAQSHNAQKRFFVANGLPESPVNSSVSYAFHRNNGLQSFYGAVSSPVGVSPNLTSTSRSSTSATHSVAPPTDTAWNNPHNPFRQSGNQQRPLVAQIQQRSPLPSLLLPPTESLLRYSPPITAHSISSFSSSVHDANIYGQMVQATRVPLTRDMYGASLSRSSTASSISSAESANTNHSMHLQLGPSLSLSSYSSSPHTYPVGQFPSEYYTPTNLSPYYSFNTLPMQTHYSVPPRMHTATPGSQSIHSLAPSLDFNHSSPVLMTVPPPAHVRAATDPLQRPSTAEPLISNPLAAEAVDALPNPHGSDIRRSASVPGSRVSGAYIDAHAARMAVQPLAGSGHGEGVRTEKPMQWKRLVLDAARA